MLIELPMSRHEPCPKLSALNLERRCQVKGGSESPVRHVSALTPATLGVVQLLMVGKLGAGDAISSEKSVAPPSAARDTDLAKSTITVRADHTRPFSHFVGETIVRGPSA